MAEAETARIGVGQEKMNENGSATLTPRQYKAVRALLTEKTVGDAAAVAGIGESTIYRWLSETQFRSALAQAEGEAVAAAGRRLAVLAETALDTVADVMADPTTPAPVRVRACEVILNNLLRYREVVTFETRLTDLEREMRGER